MDKPPHVKYCGRNCANNARRERNKPPAAVRQCEQCGAEYRSRDDRRKYCSRLCLKTSLLKPATQEKTCPNGAEQFVDSSPVRNETYCSDECRADAAKGWPKCRGCGHRFMRKCGVRNFFCSKACTPEGREAIAANEAARQTKCANCGETFATGLRRKYCSNECSREAHDGLPTCRGCGQEFQRRSRYDKYHCSYECTPDYSPDGFCSPTKAAPGSPEKIEVLKARYECGARLWHPEDNVQFDCVERIDCGKKLHPHTIQRALYLLAQGLSQSVVEERTGVSRTAFHKAKRKAKRELQACGS